MTTISTVAKGIISRENITIAKGLKGQYLQTFDMWTLDFHFKICLFDPNLDDLVFHFCLDAHGHWCVYTQKSSCMKTPVVFNVLLFLSTSSLLILKLNLYFVLLWTRLLLDIQSRLDSNVQPSSSRQKPLNPSWLCLRLC